jgi:aminoglycoside phosphotransferase family enzyme/predicted kinase
MNAQTGTTQDEIIAFLGDPGTHAGLPVERIDTHASVVMLAGKRAYKLKRAVRYPYLDFSTLERRRAACETELAINRRTAPDIYLSVVPVRRRPDGTLVLDESGEAGAWDIVEWVLVMRRFGQEALFDRLATEGILDTELILHLADAIASFHAAAEPRPTPNAVQDVGRIIEDNLTEMSRSPDLFPAAELAELAKRSRSALALQAAELDRRGRDGHVRHCHGDLHLRNIFLHDGRPTLFDAIEFDERYAVIDVLYDLAFLLMDMEHRGLHSLNCALFNRYLEQSADYGGLGALFLFLSMRAAVRAKIAAAAAQTQNEPAQANTMRNEARAYFRQALTALEPRPTMMLAVGGLSGTGKTTVARRLAEQLSPAPGAVLLRSDVLRKRMLHCPEEEKLGPAGYTPEMSERVYDELIRRAVSAAAGRTVIVDAVFAQASERERIGRRAAEAGLRFQGIWLAASLETRIARIGTRVKDASDADANIARAQEEKDLGSIAWKVINADCSLEETVAQACAALTE